MHDVILFHFIYGAQAFRRRSGSNIELGNAAYGIVPGGCQRHPRWPTELPPIVSPTKDAESAHNSVTAKRDRGETEEDLADSVPFFGTDEAC